MRLLLPPFSIPCGLVRLNCLAWGLTLRLLIRKLCPWCSRFLIATQPNIVYACLLPSWNYPIYSTVWLILSGFRSNLSPKVRHLKPSWLTFTAAFCSLRGIYSYTPVTVFYLGEWGKDEGDVTHVSFFMVYTIAFKWSHFAFIQDFII